MRILIRDDHFSRVILREQEEISINKKDFSDKSNIATQTLWPVLACLHKLQIHTDQKV